MDTNYYYYYYYHCCRWLLREAIGCLEEQGKAVVFPGSSSGDEGVKFADA
jgi:hypothetical protein